MRTQAPSLAAYTLAHFCVDFACFFILFRLKGGTGDLQAVAVGFLSYNILAFGLQPIFGALCDGRPRFPAGLLGCALVAAGLLPHTWAAMPLCALGNALFHVAGGIDSLRLSRGRMARCGVFVCAGAAGVPLGTLAGTAGAPVWLPLLLLALAAALLALLVPGALPAAAPMPGAAVPCRFGAASSLPLGAALGLALLSVALRSWGGCLFPLGWKAGAVLPLLPGFAALAGKAAGGFVGDRLGARATCVWALLLSAPLLCLGRSSPPLSLLGIALFNMTMPATLCAVADRLPHSPGLAFGLTTLALLCGCTPAFFIAPPAAAALPLLLLLIALSALCCGLSTANRASRRAGRAPNKTERGVFAP